VREHGRKAMLVRGDVSRPGDVEAMVAAVVQKLGPPDVVVNNAGVFPRVAFLDMKERRLDHVLDINLKGSFLAAQAGAAAMIAAGRAGAIVNISSSRSAVTPGACTTRPARPA
jgi:NAD(P)-dependent dehydrogenase (short-subunit alcohol dehydrogenase family)